MKLFEGAHVRLRNGVEIRGTGLVKVNEGFDIEVAGSFAWYPNGRTYQLSSRESQIDVIEILNPEARPRLPLKLEEGKYYINAKGAVCGPLQRNGSAEYPFGCDNHSYTEDGFYRVVKHADPRNLIQEITINLVEEEDE